VVGLRRPVALLAACLAPVALAAGCTTLLGVDGDYALDPSGAGGTTGSGTAGGGGAGGPGGGPPATTTSSTASDGGTAGGAGGEGGAPPASSSGASGSSGSGAGGGGGAGGGADCDEVLCAAEALIDQAPDGARNPRLSRLTSEEAAVTALVGPEGFVWTGSTDGAFLAGDYLDEATGQDAYRVDADEVLVLAQGAVDVSPLQRGSPLEGLALTPPLYGARQDVEGTSTLYYLAGRGQESAFFACDDGRPCVEAWTGCAAPPPGAPSHGLSLLGGFAVLGRVCGADRELRIDRNGQAIPVSSRTSVREVAVATQPTPLAFALTVQSDGPERHVALTRINGQDTSITHDVDGDMPGARDPAIDVTLLGVVAAWVEDGDDGALLRVLRCKDDLATCDLRRLHVVDAPAPVDPRSPSLASTGGGMLLAWEEGVAPETTVRFVIVPSLDGI
jgi:hypothetical protein